MNKKNSPIALFVYNRLDNTQKTIEHLQRNSLADESILYIFSDGGKNEESWKKVKEVRNYLHTITGFKEVHIIERPENYYLEVLHMFWENMIPLSFLKMISVHLQYFWNI